MGLHTPTRAVATGVAPLLTALLLAALAVLMTWPLLPNIARAATDPGDPYINTFTLDWVTWNWSRGSLEIFDAPIFHPAHNSLAFTEHLIGLALFALPMQLAGVEPLTAYNIVFLAAFVANGMAAYLLVWHLTRSHAAAAVAAIAYAFLPYRMAQASHLQHVWSAWLPLSLWALLRLWERPARGRAAVLAAVVLMLGLSNVHWLLFGGVALVLSAALLMLQSAERLRFAGFTAAALVVAGVALLPSLLSYRSVARQYGAARSWDETLHYSARPRDWSVPSGYMKAYQTSEHEGERRLFPGFVLIVGAMAGLLAARRRNAHVVAVLVVWLVLGFAGSLGLNASFHRLLFEHVEPFRAIRVPARWSMITYTSMAVLAGIAVASWRRAGERGRSVLAILFCAAFLWETRTFPVRWHLRGTDRAAVYDWMRDALTTGAALELPIRSASSEYEYTLAATIHHRRIVNGASGFAPPETTRIADAANAAPIPDALLDELEAIDVRVIVVHADRLGAREPESIAFLRRNVDSGRLLLVDRFFHEHRGDYVFLVRPRTRPRDAVDDRLEEQARRTTATLDFLASGKYVPTDEIVGILDWPLAGQQLSGALRVSGWAVSPYGIRRVDVLFNNGLRRFRAEHVPRPDLLDVYPGLQSTGYALDLAGRPPGVWKNGDIQIEIEDGAGRVVRLPQIAVQWQAESP